MKKVLISYINKDNTGAISPITREIMSGLKDNYEFIPVSRDRISPVEKYFPPVIKYFIYSAIQYYDWLKKILVHKPAIAHYPITSGLNFYKSLTFLLTAKLFGLKTVGHLHGGAFDIFWGGLSKAQKRLFNTLTNRIDLLIVLSKTWEEYALHNLNYRKVIILNNLINSDFENHFYNYRRDYNNKTLLFIGSLGQRKGIFKILEALKDLPEEYNLIIAGPEEDRGSLSQLNKMTEEYRLKDRVTYLGRIGLEKKIELFESCGIFVFPSNNENFPLVIIEAACAGMPVITSAVGALPEFFNSFENINFVKPSSIKEIRESIIKLLNDYELRKKLGEGGREVFLVKLNRKRILNELDDIYKSVLNNS